MNVLNISAVFFCTAVTAGFVLKSSLAAVTNSDNESHFTMHMTLPLCLSCNVASIVESYNVLTLFPYVVNTMLDNLVSSSCFLSDVYYSHVILCSILSDVNLKFLTE